MEIDNLNNMLAVTKNFKASELKDYRGQEEQSGGVSDLLSAGMCLPDADCG